MIADDARVEPEATVGEGTYVWHLAHVRDGAVVGDNCVIGGGAFIDAGVTIGDRCKIQNAAQVFGPARIGDGVFIGPGAILTNDRAPRAVNEAGAPKTTAEWNAEPVVVCEGASIGAGAAVVAGVTIGRWAMIAAGAVITRDVLDHELVAGVPATNLGWVARNGDRMKRHGETWRSPDGRLYTTQITGLVEVEE
ncbi:MAG: N-acetyltransferase [bacterium]|nr:N-acetyltransferase [bacterium]